MQAKTIVTGSFARFLVVGVFNTLAGLGTSFLLFNLLELDYWSSTFTGNTVGAVVSFTLNRTFTFRSSVPVRSSWWKFALVTAWCYGLSYGLGLGLASWLSPLLPAAADKLLSNGAILVGNGVYTISNYFGHKYVTFRAGKKSFISAPALGNLSSREGLSHGKKTKSQSRSAGRGTQPGSAQGPSDEG